MIDITTQQQQNSYLLIGATGRTGMEIFNRLLQHETKPQVHVFCRNPNKIPTHFSNQCASIIKGDARNVQDIQNALSQSNAHVVIIAIGEGDSIKKTDIRTTNAQAVVQVMQKPPYRHIKAVVISSTGAGGTRIIVGMGIGRLIEHHLRHIMHDHDGQESAFLTAVPDRTWIVRPTSLTIDKPTGMLISFGDKEKSPTIHTDRSDLAHFIVEKLYGNNEVTFGGTVNVTGIKK
eukprot:CAMPEP_0118711140 /NCGR_PEP_ID=MMETSP0800-20121206/23879_1 /TAXON_ID=210618 ORGANISM="Striatella unipunctata, Strain CCMP2910" /NCGR_SAMPLE_ID=MMETSP0800 /ASSEMBLY_ACC=CAM_ASM_000638 /LENGTH=232 /DNA_ID=CAMNT_0006615615 /DNA_START=207 /DNA_END=905 /DNA_ORIENTATION=+